MSILTDAQYTAFFDKLRAIVQRYYQLNLIQAQSLTYEFSLPELETSLASALGANATSLRGDITNATNALSTLREQLIRYLEIILTSLGRELEVTQPTTASAVVSALAQAMAEDGKTIRRRHIEIAADDLETDGSIKPHPGNHGNGILVYSLLQPTSSADSETALEDQINVVCTNANAPGQETFQLSGGPTESRSGPSRPGAGLGSTITVPLNNPLTNGDFENWSGSPAALVNWTLGTGTWGTELEQETSIVNHGAYSVKSNVAGNWKLRHAVTLNAQQVYAVGYWIRAATGATGTLKVDLTDDAGTVVQDLSFDLDVSTLVADTWTFKYKIFKGPQISRSWYLELFMDTPAVASVYIDQVQLVALTPFNGIRWGLFAGSTPFAVGDKFGYGYQNGITVRPKTLSEGETATKTSTTVITYDSFTSGDVEVGAYLKHPDGHLHRVTDVTGSDVTIAAAWHFPLPASFACVREGLLQRFITRLYGIQLPSSDTPTYEDPTHI